VQWVVVSRCIVQLWKIDVFFMWIPSPMKLCRRVIRRGLLLLRGVETARATWCLEGKLLAGSR
jgi:hypothetical protein